MIRTISRRNVLFATSAASLTTKTFAQKNEPSQWVPAIDTHTHFFDTERPGGVPWPPKRFKQIYSPHLPEHFLKIAQPLNVVGTVVVEASSLLSDNDWILELAETNPCIVGLMGNLDLGGDPDFTKNLNRLATNPLFRGIRLRSNITSRLNEQNAIADLQRMSDLNLTIDIHGRANMLKPSLEIARQFPSLRQVINHLPFKNWDGKIETMKSDLAAIAEQPKVFIKVSNVLRSVNGELIVDPDHYRPALDALLQLFGPDRLVFGSNWPARGHYTKMHKVIQEYFSSHPREVAEKFFWKNSHLAYQWVPRGKSKLLQQSGK